MRRKLPCPLKSIEATQLKMVMEYSYNRTRLVPSAGGGAWCEKLWGYWITPVTRLYMVLPARWGRRCRRVDMLGLPSRLAHTHWPLPLAQAWVSPSMKPNYNTPRTQHLVLLGGLVPARWATGNGCKVLVVVKSAFHCTGHSCEGGKWEAGRGWRGRRGGARVGVAGRGSGGRLVVSGWQGRACRARNAGATHSPHPPPNFLHTCPPALASGPRGAAPGLPPNKQHNGTHSV